MIHWRILLEEEQITECPMEREHASMTEDQTIWERIPWDPHPSKVDYNRVLLDYFIPSLTGKAKVLDDFLHRQPKNLHMGNQWKGRVERDNICLHHEDSDDLHDLVSTLLQGSDSYHWSRWKLELCKE